MTATKTKKRKRRKRVKFLQGTVSCDQPRFHLDENISGCVARTIRSRGLSVTTTRQAKLISARDIAQLRYATRERRIIVTHDRDFIGLHNDGCSHAGILYIPLGMNARDIADRLEALFEDIPEALATEVIETPWALIVFGTLAILTALYSFITL